MKRSRGFTLIELMIVVAIISILVSIAVHAYLKSISKTELSEAFTIADGVKTTIISYHSQYGACPTNSATGFMPAASYSGKYVRNAVLSNTGNDCTIALTFKSAGSVSPQIANQAVTFTLAGTLGDGTRNWACSSTIAAQYLPKSCL